MHDAIATLTPSWHAAQLLWVVATLPCLQSCEKSVQPTHQGTRGRHVRTSAHGLSSCASSCHVSAAELAPLASRSPSSSGEAQPIARDEARAPMTSNTRVNAFISNLSHLARSTDGANKPEL